MAYYSDLEKISINEYRQKLELAYLPPSRRILTEHLDERFNFLIKSGITNLSQLLTALKKKDEFAKLSAVDCFTKDYLTILLREINSIHPKPNKLSEFDEMSTKTIANLAKIGITNTEKLYNVAVTQAGRHELANITGEEYDELTRLTKLADLSRIKWVGARYAQLLYSLGLDCAEKVSKSALDHLHRQINQQIREKNIFKGAIGLNDVKILIAAAGDLDYELEL